MELEPLEFTSVRAETVDGHSIEGYLVLIIDSDKAFVSKVMSFDDPKAIKISSVCRNTLLRDKDGQKVYEFDCLQDEDDDTYIVYFDESRAAWVLDGDVRKENHDISKMKIVGNCKVGI